MKTFRIWLQFFTPESHPTGVSEFTQQAETKEEAEEKMIKDLKSWGRGNPRDYHIIRISEE